jgi:hypothetical protein
VEQKIRVEISKDAKFFDVVTVYRGRFVEPEDFDKVFENASEVFKFFENSIILGAVIDSARRRVYFITLSTNHEVPYATLTIWEAEIEVKRVTPL